MITYVNVDLDKYIIYENIENDSLVAVEKTQQDRMIDLYRKYDKFKSAPDSEVTDAYILQPSNKPNTFHLNERFKETLKINQLKGTIIRVVEGY